MTYRKKLIEVALPLEAINKASAREKSIRHGHPSTLHLWWARRPLAAARAVIFAQMVDDPSAWPDLFPTEKAQDKERQRLFRIIEDLVLWENTTNETVLERAREEIRQSWRRTCAENADHPRAKELFDRNKLPAFHDPFAGGGALPLEAQRRGLEAYASDLNPVAVLICKAMIEIPPKFVGKPPVNPEARSNLGHSSRWHSAQGLAEDVRYYGQWMRNEAEKRVGHLYPKAKVTAEMAKGRPDLTQYVGKELTVIAWLWARTVKSLNPAFGKSDVPLVSTFMLSKKEGKETYVEPVVEGSGYRFTIKVGKPKDAEATESGTKLSRGSFRCIFSDVPIPYEYIDDEANAGRMSERLMAIVAEGIRERVYLTPTSEMEAVARSARPAWKPDIPSRGTWASNAQGRRYGFRVFGDYFTPRQLVTLTTFCDLVPDARERVKRDALAAGLTDDGKPLRDGGTGAAAYSDAVAVYLGFAVSKSANRASTLCTFKTAVECPGDTFGRQALPMSWDYAEANSVSGPSGSFQSMVSNTVAGLLSNGARLGSIGHAEQVDATVQPLGVSKVISTDPPYYDNIGYADLSDFFYAWLRRSLQPVFPDLFATLAVPKAEELVACSYRHGGKERAEAFFLDGMTRAMHRLAEQAHPAFPVTVYYAFKQSETEDKSGTASTGWETFLDAVVRAGFAVLGTWPMRTERENRKVNQGANALASSIVLVCRARPDNAPLATRKEFSSQLRKELPEALVELQQANIAPVDFAQAAIGPGMAVFTRYAKVIEAGGGPMSVRTALQIINQELDAYLAEQEGELDRETRFCVAWFGQHGMDAGEYGEADVLARALDTAVKGLAETDVLRARAGKVELLDRSELPADWNPAEEKRLTVWECAQQLIRALGQGGEKAAAALVAKLGAGKSEEARALAYRLYAICERKKWAKEALAYNSLVVAWPEIVKLAASKTGVQTDAFGRE